MRIAAADIHGVHAVYDWLVEHTRNAADGYWPRAGLIRESSGNFYGTAAGGDSGYGTVFKLAP